MSKSILEANLLENRLGEPWSAKQFAETITSDKLISANEHYSIFSVEVKLRLLLSLLLLPIHTLSELNIEIEKLLQTAYYDKNEWIRTILHIVKKRLPCKTDLGIIEKEINEETNRNKDSDKKVLFSSKKDTSCIYNDMLTEFIEKLGFDSNENDTENNMDMQDSEKNSYIIDSNFIPFEWSFMCEEVLPPDIKIDKVNRHFIPSQNNTIFPNLSAVSSVAQHSLTTPAQDVNRMNSCENNDEYLLDSDSYEAKSRNISNIPSSNFEDKQLSGVPDGIKRILLDKKNIRVTKDDIAKVVHAFSVSDSKEAGTIEIFLLSESQQIDNGTALITEHILKLDVATKKATKTKRKRRITYALSENLTGNSPWQTEPSYPCDQSPLP